MRRLAFAAAILLAASAPALADDVSDAIGEAQKAYSGGDIAGAKQSLDLASQLIAQKQSDALAKLLPEPPAGWTADAPDANGSAGSFLGGGQIVSRRYHKDGGDANVQLMANSPILGQLAPLFSNIQMLGGMGRVFRATNRTGVMTNEGEIQMVVGKTYLTIEGSAPEADKKAILQTIDLDAVEAFAK